MLGNAFNSPSGCKRTKEKAKRIQTEIKNTKPTDDESLIERYIEQINLG